MTNTGPERRTLGRGLSALMADLSKTDEVPVGGTAIRRVPTDHLSPNPDQPRRTFPKEQLQELAESLRQKGVVQPLLVRPLSEAGRFQIVAGERRWRAAQIAGLKDVPVIVVDYTDQETLEIAIIENVQREGLNAIDEAQALRDLMTRFGRTQDDVAKSLSKSRSHVANSVRLLGLPDAVLDFVRTEKLSAGHARALINCSDPVAMAAEVIGRSLSVRQTEQMTSRKAGTRKPVEDRVVVVNEAEIARLETALAACFERPVSITQNGRTCMLSVVINCKDGRDLAAFAEGRLKVGSNA